MLIQFPCPVCKSHDEKELINEYNYISVSQYFCPESRDKDRNKRYAEAIRRLWQQDIGFFLRCKICRFGFGYPYIGGDEEFYKIVHEQFQYPLNRWEYDLTLSKFFKQQAPTKILDIGAGVGYFLDKIQVEEKYAMEGSESIRSILRKKGIKVYINEKVLIQENARSFNYITMFQVLEHIAEFENILSNSNKLLIHHGSLIISVPDCDAMILQAKITGYPDIFPNHINKWTPGSLKIVLKNCGFDVDEIIFEPPSIRKFFDSIHLKISHKATKKGTFASLIYKIKIKKLRIVALLFYSFIELPSSLYYYKKLDRSGGFLVKAKKMHDLN